MLFASGIFESVSLLYKINLIAWPIMIAAAIAEARMIGDRDSHAWKDAAISAFDVVFRPAVIFFLPLSTFYGVEAFAHTHRLTNIPLNGWTIAALYIGQDFCYYVYHVASHRIRWFWTNHAAHHAPTRLNLVTGVRAGPLGHLIGTMVFYSPLLWVGFPNQAVFACLQINNFYQFYLHMTWPPKLGWLEYVLNTPSNHRVHHAINPEYRAGNFGGTFIIFDRLFGTYIEEREEISNRYGLRDKPPFTDLFQNEFSGWIDLAKDAFRARRPREIWRLFFLE